jgi:hypothetical protein
MDARKDDESLENMMHDIEEGDGVVRILEELSKEDEKESTSDESKEAAKYESEHFSFEDEIEDAAEQTVPTETKSNVQE